MDILAQHNNHNMSRFSNKIFQLILGLRNFVVNQLIAHKTTMIFVCLQCMYKQKWLEIEKNMYANSHGYVHMCTATYIAN